MKCNNIYSGINVDAIGAGIYEKQFNKDKNGRDEV